MSSTPAATQNFVQPSCTARDPSVAAAAKAVSATSFTPLAGDTLVAKDTALGQEVAEAVASAATAGARFDEVLTDAIAFAASDVHFEPSAGGARIRYRVHGRMLDAPGELSAAELAAIAATVEQTNGTTWTINGNTVALLARVHRTMAGPSVTVRVIADTNQSSSLADLGLSADVMAACRNALSEPRGLILVAGPARSGRSTAVRAAIQECADDAARKVVAVVGENVPPVPFVATTQADDRIDAAVATAIRDALQQNVDVLHVDAASGTEAMAELVRAAHRGHLVIATTAGNDFREALQDMVDAGVTNNAIASNVTAVMVQHLARRNCSQCREPVAGTADQIAAVLPNVLAETASHFECSGCQECNNTGFAGQVPVVEFVPNSPALRSALRRGVAPHDLTAIARQNGLQSLHDSAVALLQSGEISLAELCRVVTEEQREGASGCSSTGTCS